MIADAHKKSGAFLGVFTPGILTILGVIMYLRFGWVVASAGVGGTLPIVVIRRDVPFITALIAAAVATHLSAVGVHPRTAMAAMRHSRMELTMNYYTDPILLDVAGAVEALPDFGAGVGIRALPIKAGDLCE